MLFEVILPIISGVLSIIGGVTQRNKFSSLLSNGKRVKGIVFSIKQVKKGTIPIVRFTTHKNEWITKELRNGFNLGYFNEGDEIEVIYNPNNPEKAEIYQPNILSFMPVFLILLGIGLFIYGYINFIEYV